jgi:hypothetical protein
MLPLSRRRLRLRAPRYATRDGRLRNRGVDGNEVQLQVGHAGPELRPLRQRRRLLGGGHEGPGATVRDHHSVRTVGARRQRGLRTHKTVQYSR